MKNKSVYEWFFISYENKGPQICDLLFNREYYHLVTWQLQLFLNAILKAYLLFLSDGQILGKAYLLTWKLIKNNLFLFLTDSEDAWSSSCSCLSRTGDQATESYDQLYVVSGIFFSVVVVVGVHFEILRFDASNIDLVCKISYLMKTVSLKIPVTKRFVRHSNFHRNRIKLLHG